jgi:hypothetical protein
MAVKVRVENSAQAKLAARVKTLERLDSEAGQYVESVIVLRTHFTGKPPYVGWKGLGLALGEALDERDAALLVIKDLKAEIVRLKGEVYG